MKLLLICTLLAFTIPSYSQDTLSIKMIDSLIKKIDNLVQRKIISTIDELNAFDTIRGYRKDTAFSIYTINPKNNSLLKYTYIWGTDNVNEVFYFHNDRLIAAKIISEDDFPSWSWSMHYFTKPFAFKEGELLDWPSGSQDEAVVRKHLMYAGWHVLKYYNSKLKSRK